MNGNNCPARDKRTLADLIDQLKKENQTKEGRKRLREHILAFLNEKEANHDRET
jgi:hypothetical protein